ncbi:MAG: hypothetical protein MUE46_11805 [Xanthomonadales bacterium]|jgi:hypothetical protein|nr:hypothetical protein [Xanthomonadales bacterium]
MQWSQQAAAWFERAAQAGFDWVVRNEGVRGELRILGGARQGAKPGTTVRIRWDAELPAAAVDPLMLRIAPEPEFDYGPWQEVPRSGEITHLMGSHALRAQLRFGPEVIAHAEQPVWLCAPRLRVFPQELRADPGEMVDLEVYADDTRQLWARLPTHRWQQVPARSRLRVRMPADRVDLLLRAEAYGDFEPVQQVVMLSPREPRSAHHELHEAARRGA